MTNCLRAGAGIAVAIADRLDTLTGLFGINQPPTGSKDPFALRRAALGVLRIMVERNLNLDLRELIAVSADSHKDLPARDGLEDKGSGLHAGAFPCMVRKTKVLQSTYSCPYWR